MTTHRAPSRLVGSRSRVRLHRRQSAGLRERVNVTYLTGAHTTIGRDGHTNTDGGVGRLHLESNGLRSVLEFPGHRLFIANDREMSRIRPRWTGYRIHRNFVAPQDD